MKIDSQIIEISLHLTKFAILATKAYVARLKRKINLAKTLPPVGLNRVDRITNTSERHFYLQTGQNLGFWQQPFSNGKIPLQTNALIGSQSGSIDSNALDHQLAMLRF